MGNTLPMAKNEVWERIRWQGVAITGKLLVGYKRGLNIDSVMKN